MTDAPNPLSDTLLANLTDHASVSAQMSAEPLVAPVFVDTLAAQQTVDLKLAQAPVLGVDTEFIRETTFHPKLALIQLAFPDQSQQYILDTPALTLPSESELTQLKQKLLCANTVKIMHGCSEDIEIFLHFCEGAPENVFDTQIAAALLGERAQIGYDSLVAGILGAKVDKSATRSDWLKRPLTPVQISYAAADVAYLFPLYDTLNAALVKNGRRQWLTDEYQQLLYGLRNPVPATSFYQRLGLHWRLRGRALYVLQQMCIWREEQVRERNIPRSFLLSDAGLMAVAKLQYPTATQLRRLEEIKPGQWRRYGQEIVEALKRIIDQAPAKAGEDLPVIMPKPKKYRPLVKSLKAVVTKRAQALGLEASVLLGKRYLHQFLNMAEQQVKTQGGVDLSQLSGPPWLTGWRQEQVLTYLVDPLLAWLQAQEAQ